VYSSSDFEIVKALLRKETFEIRAPSFFRHPVFISDFEENLEIFCSSILGVLRLIET
jgi:hypothetical protein